MRSAREDLVYALRRLARRPAFALVATATLALGIGGAVAIFSVAHAVMLRPLPYAAPDRLVMLWQKDERRGQPFGELYPAFRDWRAEGAVFEDLAGLPSTNQSWTLGGRGEPVELSGRLVTWNFSAAVTLRPLWGAVGMDWPFAVEGQSPSEAERNPLLNFETVSPDHFRTRGIPLKRGRPFDARDREGRPGVVIVSEALARRYWAAVDAIGKLGARPRHVARLVAGEGLRPALAGVALGLAGAVPATRLLAGLLFGVDPLDGLTLAGSAALLPTVAVLAAALPARRALRVEPAAALRES
jgi:hypothetical protein